MISDKHPEQPLAEEALSVSRSSTAEEFCKRWLGMQCSQLTSIDGGVVVLGSGETGKFSPVAVWPEGSSPRKPLMDATERTLALSTDSVAVVSLIVEHWLPRPPPSLCQSEDTQTHARPAGARLQFTGSGEVEVITMNSSSGIGLPGKDNLSHKSN